MPSSDGFNTYQDTKGIDAAPETSSPGFFTSPDGMRLRLLALFALYDALPHSIAQSPEGEDPMDLDSAIAPEAVRNCLQSMKQTGKLSYDEAEAMSAAYAPQIREVYSIVTSHLTGLLRGVPKA
ncbi:hypothetical protein NMY22_g6419 [Coprinellus aureogranulatus]|nr:hypothetical protein NMY22_g6419 [Coprinellus aureogranulatus]